MHITCTTNPHTEELHGILHCCSRAIAHSTPEYARMLEHCVGGTAHWLVAYAGQEPVGMLPFLVRHHPEYGRVVNSLPFFGAHGGCLVRDDAPQQQTRRALLDAFKEHALGLPDVLSASISISFTEYENAPLYADTLHADATDMRRAQVLALPTHNIAESIMAKHSTARIVRKALRQGFVIRCEEDDVAWQALYDMQAQAALRQHATPKTREQIFAFRNALNPGQRALWCAYADEKIIAALLLTLHTPWVHYSIPAFDVEYSSQQPMTALIYNAMCHYAEQGYTRWSFGGTPLASESLHRFKAGWGAQDAAYAYMTIASEPIKKIFKEHKNAVLTAFSGYYVYPF